MIRERVALVLLPALLPSLAALASCGGSTPEPVAAPRHTIEATSTPPKPKAPAPKPAQVFAETYPGFAFADPDRVKKLRTAIPAIEAAAAEELAKQKIPSLAVGLVIDGELAWSRGFGAMDLDTKAAPDADTVYRIGSITKSFTGLAVLSLRDEGALSLDEPLTRLVPEAGGLVYPARDGAPMTLRQILTHTSGLPRRPSIDIHHDPTEAALLQSLDKFPLATPPGTSWSYSNLGFALLGIAAGRAGHTSYRKVVDERVLAPIGMTATVWDAAKVPAGRLARPYEAGKDGAPQRAEPWILGAAEGAGGLYSSVRDMARWVALQLDAYPPRNAPESRRIRRSTVREAHSTGFSSGLYVGSPPTAQKGDPIVSASSEHYGFGWISEQTCEFDPLVWHNGGIDGFSSDLRLLPNEGVGVVVLANMIDVDPGVVSMKALRALAKTGGLSRRTLAPSPAFAAVMPKLVAVMNQWDERDYAAMLSPGRPPFPREKEELAGYHDRHGTCRGFTVVEVMIPTAARFRIDCDKKPLEMEVSLGQKGLIDGFTGTTTDVPLPPDEKKAATALSRLLGKWDEALYKQILASSTRSRDETFAFFDRVRNGHGACTVKSGKQKGFNRSVILACDRGGDISLSMTLDDKDHARVKSFGMRNVQQGTCPVR